MEDVCNGGVYNEKPSVRRRGERKLRLTNYTHIFICEFYKKIIINIFKIDLYRFEKYSIEAIFIYCQSLLV